MSSDVFHTVVASSAVAWPPCPCVAAVPAVPAGALAIALVGGFAFAVADWTIAALAAVPPPVWVATGRTAALRAAAPLPTLSRSAPMGGDIPGAPA